MRGEIPTARKLDLSFNRGRHGLPADVEVVRIAQAVGWYIRLSIDIIAFIAITYISHKICHKSHDINNCIITI
jgi:hypothetical protein